MFSALPAPVAALLALAAAAILAYSFIPPVKRIAEQTGAIDRPDAARRIHTAPIPRLGGLAIFLGFALSAALFTAPSLPVSGLLLGALLTVIAGAADDLRALRPWLKLLLQLEAALICLRCDLVIERLSVPGFGLVPLGALAWPLTALWIVGCTNAVNLIDGLDGLAAGLALISALPLMLLALLSGDGVSALLLAGLAGGCAGFLPYNRNPARIFMGDAGSQLLGYVLGAVSVLGAFKRRAALSFLVPVLALALPLADTGFAFVRRLAHGKNPFLADRGHLHHRLLARGLDQRQAVAVMYALAAMTGLLALALGLTAAAP